MLSIPLALLLGIYGAFLLIFVLFVIISIYHLGASASITFWSMLVTLLLTVLGAGVIYTSAYLLRDVDWSERIIFFESSWFAPSEF